MPHRLDLVRRHIQLVATAVFEQQIVALVATDCAGDHAAEPGDAVLMVDDKAAFSQILEKPLGIACAAPGLTVRAAAAGDIGFCDHGELDVAEDDAAFDRGDDHFAGGPTLPSPSRSGSDVEHDLVLGHQGAESVGTGLAISGHHDPVAVVEQASDLADRGRQITHDRFPTGRRDNRCCRLVGRRQNRPRRCVGAGHEPVEVEV